MNVLPGTRKGLLRLQLDGQLLLYNDQCDIIHLLDETSGCVFDILEQGEWTAESLRREVESRLGRNIDPLMIKLALEELRTYFLFEEDPFDREDTLVDRRSAVRRLAAAGVAAVLVPAITTFAASNLYAQASPCRTLQQSCSPGVCCAGLTCRSGTNPSRCCNGVGTNNFGPGQGSPCNPPACCSGQCAGGAGGTCV